MPLSITQWSADLNSCIKEPNNWCHNSFKRRKKQLTSTFTITVMAHLTEKAITKHEVLQGDKWMDGWTDEEWVDERGVCRDAPLRSITEVIAQLFEGVNLSPSDMTAALVLVAAAQHRRRKVQIENALERTAGTSTSMTETPDIADVAGGSHHVRARGLVLYTACITCI